MDLLNILHDLPQDENGIFASEIMQSSQMNEIKMRDQVAGRYQHHSIEMLINHLSKYHSLAVMDHEFKKFLLKIKKDGIVLDVGAGWGQNWRAIQHYRNDVTGVLVDFSYQNLLIARKILADHFNKRVYLVHADATKMPFNSEVFDGYWTVQTLQYVPNFEQAIEEAFRVLKPNAIFCTYSFNRNPPLAFKEKLPLTTSLKMQKKIIEMIFNNLVEVEFSELLFHPPLLSAFAGKEDSRLGQLDAKLSGAKNTWRSLFARQRSFHTKKILSTESNSR